MVYPVPARDRLDVCTRAGFPPCLLSEVNFQAMFEAQQQQLARSRAMARRRRASRIVLN
jgi:preprotein translocase subunit SecB